jgi:hypothetical protein
VVAVSLKSYFLSRQAEFLHEIAAGYEAETGLDHWWIGLTDLSKYFKQKKAYQVLVI